MNYIEIIDLRKKYNISQTKLAEASGFGKADLSAWELGKRVPSAAELETVYHSLTNIIDDINHCVFDVRKKRILHSKKEKGKLPDTIKSPEDYNARLSERKLKCSNPYRSMLSELYGRAISPKSPTAPKAISLFSGCGGLDLGFAAEGFDFVGHVEIEDSANGIYQSNFQNSDCLGKDVCKITDAQIREWKHRYGDIDIIVGGPPCQGFSLAGKRDSNDARNQLYTYYVHLVSVIRPKLFVLENVRLLTSMKAPDGTLFIEHITKGFSQAGYSITGKELNACDYGVPQSRERIILVGVRNDLKKPFRFPENKFADASQGNTLFELKEKRTFKDATFDLDELESGERSSDPLHWSIVHPEHVIRWLRDVPEGCSAHENADPALRPPSGFNTTYKRILWNEPCSTISTNFSMISGCRNVHPTSTRSLTIREAARAQSFPDEFVFFGNWGDIRKAIGNAVPPLLASKIAKAIFEQFFADKE